jgi:hypothetical protein
MRIRQRATACASRWFDLARSETWTKDCPRHARDQQQTQQELAVGTARWACRTWVSGSYGYPRSWDHRGSMWGLTRGCSQPTKIMGDHGGKLHITW